MKYLAESMLLLLLLLKLCHGAVYTDQWAVHVEGGESVARLLAEKHGFRYLGPILRDYHLLQHRRVSKRSAEPSPSYHSSIAQENQVKWVEQQVSKKRMKRDGGSYNDPKWPRMWYLNRGRNLDMNVEAAWSKGYTGKGVVVSILDDGIEKDHPDLKRNFDPDASYDVNAMDSDPTPRYDYTNENRHGTRCAGEVAAVADNNICSVGVAYDASIGGVRMLDGEVTDSVEAKSLSRRPDHIDIYSASWGPDDDGRTVDGPGTMARAAFIDGITNGRNGKGSIFVWASGNGGRDGDSCNCDGYTNSIFTLSISSATENGHIPWYSEACSSTLTTTYSSGSGGERQIVTTDLRKGCTEGHTGTSASAPLAAGIVALALQACPSLTWRDMQHIVVLTARPANLVAQDWVTNGIGRRVSHHFGFGLMDAGAMVDLARNWTSVPEQHRCEARSTTVSRGIPVNGNVEVSLNTDGCLHSRERVVYLEHVEAKITLSASRRGQIEIFLTSPHGTRSTLLARRSRDTSTEGFNDWTFMTTHNWGEFAKGKWILEVRNAASTSTLKDWSLSLYGTATKFPPNRGSRVQACPDGQYLLPATSFCFHTCPMNFYPANVSISENTTELTVGDVTYHNVSWLWNVSNVMLCQPCDEYCMQCEAPDHQTCLKCASGYAIVNGSCHYSHAEPVPSWMNLSSTYMVLIVVAVVVSLSLSVFACIFGLLQVHSKGLPCGAGPDVMCKRHRTPVQFRRIDPEASHISTDRGLRNGGQRESLLNTDSDSNFDSDDGGFTAEIKYPIHSISS